MAIRRIHEDQERTEHDARSLRGLASELTGEFSRLFRQEIALARAETADNIAQARSGAVMIAVGSIIAFAGLFVLLMAGVYALGEVMHPAWAAVIVGALALIVGGIAAKSGSSNLKARKLVPHRTADTLREDADMAARRTQR